MIETKEKIRTILIVDDTKENVDLLEAILSAEYNTKVATRGSDALEIARETPPDLILLDVMMPEMDGYTVCRALKADTTTKRIPVIFVTSLITPGDEQIGFEAGSVDYITKPVVGAVVRTRVKAQLALKEAQDVLEEWNCNLKKRLMQSITTIRQKTEELMSADEKAASLYGYVLSVELLSGVFELMENRFGVQARAISELAGDAARKMNLSAEEVAKIRLAGLLHDVGTLGARRSSSEKAETDMTLNEREEFHSHPVYGQELFKSLKKLHDVGLMVRSHHEAYDGSGFPDSLKGDEIPIGARLIAIADHIEHAASSVASDRDAYALMKTRMSAGKQLDPKLVSYFTMITRIMYFDGKKTDTTGEVEIPQNELTCGMQLSRDFNNQGGVLLLKKGDKLDASGIALIRRKRQTNVSKEDGVWIYIDSKQ